MKNPVFRASVFGGVIAGNELEDPSMIRDFREIQGL